MSLVVIEGLDGSGKSSQVKLIKKYLKENNIKYKYVHFPQLEDNIFGEQIARFLRGELGDIDQVDPYIVALLYAEDRNFTKTKIYHWLNDGYVVLLDRYVNSNIAFQCAKTQDKEKLKEWILELEYDNFKLPKPDREIFLNVPVHFIERNLNKERKGDDRDYLNGKEDIHESSIEFQKQVREMYLELCESQDNLKKIECCDNEGDMPEKEVVFSKIMAELKPFLKNN